MSTFLLAEGARGKHEDKGNIYFLNSVEPMEKKNPSLCSSYFSMMIISISTLGWGSQQTLFQHHMRDNYRVPKYQPASVSPKYSRPN